MRVRTGIAVEARHPETGAALGLLVRDRSSMAARGVATTAGVIDAGYRGEILVLMTNLGEAAVELKAGEKIAQMIPVPVLTGWSKKWRAWKTRRGRRRGLAVRESKAGNKGPRGLENERTLPGGRNPEPRRRHMRIMRAGDHASQ